MILDIIKKKIEKNLNLIISLKKYKKIKVDNSYVSKADLLIEKIINDVFKKKFNNNFFLLSEENFSEKSKIPNVKYIVVLDPIDGTENFVSGLPIWGISICVYKEKKHYKSLLFFPELNLIAKTGVKLEKNFSRIMAMSSSNNRILKKITNLNEVRITGCCIYNIYNVLNGKFKSYHNPKANIWDFLAGLNIAHDNNLYIRVDNKKYNGELLKANKKYDIKIKN